MATLRDVMLYICDKYPVKDELSKARLNKIIYLADWRSAILRRHQITTLVWTFNHYGPYLDEIVDVAKRDPAFTLEQTHNMFGSPKEVVKLATHIRTEPSTLSAEDYAILDHVLGETSPMGWNRFIKLVYSTYPIVTQPRYEALDLVALAAEYNQSKASLS